MVWFSCRSVFGLDLVVSPFVSGLVIVRLVYFFDETYRLKSSLSGTKC